MCHCHLLYAVVSVLVKLKISSTMCIIDVLYILTNCSGRDRQSVLRERMKKLLVQWQAFLICHCHLLSAVVEIDKVR